MGFLGRGQPVVVLLLLLALRSSGAANKKKKRQVSWRDASPPEIDVVNASAAVVEEHDINVDADGKPRFEVTLMTHSSLDRLWNVRAICERWRGPLSLALYAPGLPRGPAAQAEEMLVDKCEPHIVSAVTLKSDRYPINRLRNMALLGASGFKTSHVFVVDADFWPNPRSRVTILETLNTLAATESLTWRTALIVPSFAIAVDNNKDSHAETYAMWAQGTDHVHKVANAAMPRTIGELKRCLSRCKSIGRKQGRRRWLLAGEEEEEEYNKTTAPLRRRRLLAGEEEPSSNETTAPLRRRRLEEEEELATGRWRKYRRSTYKEAAAFGEGARFVKVAKRRRVIRRRPKTVRKAAESVTCEPFHHHGSTRFAQWLVSNEPQRVPCFVGNFYEPFVVVPTPDFLPSPKKPAETPLFDEKFDGYGKNKIEWIVRLRASNFTFWTVPKAFLVHSFHRESAAKKKWAVDGDGKRLALNQQFFQSLHRLGIFERENCGWLEQSLQTKHCFGSEDLFTEVETKAKKCGRVAEVARACAEIWPGQDPTAGCEASLSQQEAIWTAVDRKSNASAARQSATPVCTKAAARAANKAALLSVKGKSKSTAKRRSASAHFIHSASA